MSEKLIKNSNDIIRASKVATIIFTALVFLADVFGYIISRYVTYVWIGDFSTKALVITTAVFYICTLFAYGLLFSVYKLLGNMSKDIVFDSKNTKLMGTMVWCLIFIGVFCAAEVIVWPGCLFLSVIAWFMTLIVLCVKVVFDKAISMKDELDLTI